MDNRENIPAPDDTVLLFRSAFRPSDRRHFARAFPRGKPDCRPRVGSRPRPFLVDLDLHLDLDSVAARLVPRSRFSSSRAVKPRTCFGKRIRHFHVRANGCDTLRLIRKRSCEKIYKMIILLSKKYKRSKEIIKYTFFSCYIIQLLNNSILIKSDGYAQNFPSSLSHPSEWMRYSSAIHSCIRKRSCEEIIYKMTVLL